MLKPRRFVRPLRPRGKLVRVHARPELEAWVLGYLKRNGGFDYPVMEGVFVKMQTQLGSCFVSWSGKPGEREYTVEELR